MYVVLYKCWLLCSGQDMFRLMLSVIFSSCWQLQTSVTKKSESWKYPSSSRVSDTWQRLLLPLGQTRSISGPMSSCVHCSGGMWPFDNNNFINFCSNWRVLIQGKLLRYCQCLYIFYPQQSPMSNSWHWSYQTFCHTTKLTKNDFPKSIIFSRTLQRHLWHCVCRPGTWWLVTSVCIGC